MPRIANEIDSKDLKKIKEDVLCRYGKPLTKTSDCDKLAIAISEKTKSYINGITFKRLFGFTKSNFFPSRQTLDILCNYIGYDNWQEYLNCKKNGCIISEKEIEIYKSTYNIDEINEVNDYEGGLQSMSRMIIKNIIKAPNSFKKVIDALADNKYAQIYLFEHFPIYDCLIPFYDYAYTVYLEHKHTQEAQLFGNEILFLKALWTFNKKEAKKRIANLIKTGVSLDIHPFTIGRYFASILYYTHFFEKKDTKPIVEKIFDFEKKIKIGKYHFMDFQAYNYIVSEALLHCKLYKEAIEIIDLGFEKYKIKKEFVRKGYYRQMQMFKADALIELGDKEQATMLMKKINPENFYFISKKYYTTLYHLTKYKIEPNQLSKDVAKRFIKEMQNEFFEKKYEEVIGETIKHC